MIDVSLSNDQLRDDVEDLQKGAGEPTVGYPSLSRATLVPNLSCVGQVRRDGRWMSVLRWCPGRGPASGPRLLASPVRSLAWRARLVLGCSSLVVGHLRWPGGDRCGRRGFIRAGRLGLAVRFACGGVRAETVSLVMLGVLSSSCS